MGGTASRPDYKSASPSADDDPIFWRGSRFSYASPASVQCPMKKGGMGEGEEEKEEEEEAARSRTAVWVKLFDASWQLSSRFSCYQPSTGYKAFATGDLLKKYLLWNPK